MIKLAPGDLAALPARGEDPSLESIALRRKLAAALMAKAADTSPVGHWTQALARGLQGWGGYLQDQQADKQDKGLRKDANAALMQLLAPSVTGGASPAAYPPQPAVNQAKEAMLPEQPMTPEQEGVANFAKGMGTPNMSASIPKVAGAMDVPPVASRGLTTFAGLVDQGGPARNAAFDMSKIAASLGPEALPRPNASMFDFLKSDPNYVDRTGGGGNRDPGNVNKVILHDRGGNYNGSSPYHVEVLPDGKIVNSWRPDQKAPHAYRSNPTSVGVAYGGQVGATPTPQAMASLQKVVNGLKDQNPDLEVDSHGEAFRDTRGTSMQASKLGRGLDEASWRSDLRNPVQAPPQMAAQPAAAPPAQVADASGQTVDRATLERMLQNPYSRDAAMKIIQKQAFPDKADTPSNVREYEYFKALPKDQQEQYLRMRRAEKYLDQGPQYINPQTGQTFAKDPAEVERQKEIGTAQGKQAASAPGDISAAEQALTVLGQIKTDEYLNRGTGLSSFGNMVPGTGGYDFEALVSQAKSGAFLTAIQQLRGMGALSNAEGQTATEAVTRMKTGLSKEAFLKAVSDYEAVIKKGMAQAQARLSGAAPKMPPPGAGGGWSIQKVQ